MRVSSQSESPAEILRAAVAVAGPVVDLAEAALACAALDRGGLDLAPYRQHLAELIGDMRAREKTTPPMELASVLAQWHGYRGDCETYDDIANADIAHVIDRRKGLPVALSILWMHVARGCGWRCRGLNTPGHFVIRLDAQGSSWILDPFDGGTILDHQALQMLIGRDEKLTVGNVADEHGAAVEDETHAARDCEPRASPDVRSLRIAEPVGLHLFPQRLARNIQQAGGVHALPVDRLQHRHEVVALELAHDRVQRADFLGHRCSCLFR